jgi:hypothetical protein
MIFAVFTLITALTISAVAAYYSIVGLTAIFSAAVIPIIIMGASLEVGKVVAAVWLKLNWQRAKLTYKLYLVPAVAFLMLLTSMGIFGFLSKAHSDQSLVTGDAMSRVLIYDEKITTEKDNIAQAKKALEQMNAQVDQMLSRTDSERGTDKAVIVRKQQAKERAELQASINKSQKEIQRLQTERAPLAAESRKIEAEVGPIKYIAALLYGDNPDQNILERAVRWVIIIIVLVFDPLALVLILAAQQSFNWAREDKEKAIDQLEQSSTNKIDNEDENTDRASSSEDVSHTADAGDGNLQPQSNQIGLTPEETQAFLDQVKRNEEEYLASLNEEIKTEAEFFDRAEYAALTADILDEQNRATEANAAAAEIEKPEPSYEADDGPLTDDQIAQIKDSVEEEKTVSTVAATEEPPAESPPLAEGLMEEEKSVEVAQNIEDTPPPPAPRDNVKIKKMEGGYWDVNSKIMSTEVLSVTNPELYKKYVLEADNVNAEDITSGFGTSFPHQPRRGDMFLRVDYQPNKLFKFNGVKWIEINKDSTNAYAYDEQYLNFLIEKLRSGEYELDQLSDTERELVENKLNNIVHQESKNDKT